VLITFSDVLVVSVLDYFISINVISSTLSLQRHKRKTSGYAISQMSKYLELFSII